MAFTFAALVAFNLICWRPGVGSNDGTVPGRTRGTELERYFGWPSQYRAELWHSEDPDLSQRILQVAPAYFPGREMQLRVRYVGAWAVIVNFLFSMTVAALMGIANEYRRPGVRSRWIRGLAPVLLVCAVALLLGADRVSVYL